MVLKSVETGQITRGRGRKVRFGDDEGPSEYEMMKQAAMDDIKNEVAAYTKKDYALGEYNFPQDGYDYSKHLKEVGADRALPCSRFALISAAHCHFSVHRGVVVTS